MADAQRPRRAPVLVGIAPGQHPEVARAAAALAAALGTGLVVAWADPARYVVREHADGSVVSDAIDPDAGEGPGTPDGGEALDPLRAVLDAGGAPWTFRCLAGEPARALAQLAAAVGARTIVVGSREPGLVPRLAEFFTGSVAVQLTHRQRIPVLVVPVTAEATQGRAAWE
jgi:nucleotide-binding universal stress UspA family protein